MVKHPIENKKTLFEFSFNIISLILLIIIFVYIMIIWSDIPNSIPMTFDSNGHVSHWGEKKSILALPLFGLLIWFVFSFIEKDPHNINLPLYRSDDKSKELKYNRILVNAIKNGIVICFVIANWRIIFSIL